MTQLEMTTSTEASSSGICFDAAVEELDVRRPGLGGVAAGQLEHLDGGVESVGEAGRADPTGRQQHVDAAARAEVQHGVTGLQVGDGDRVAAPEADAHRGVRQAGEVVVVAGTERTVAGGAAVAGVTGVDPSGRLGVAGEDRIGRLGHQQAPVAQTSPLSSHGATSGRRPMISSAAEGKQARQRSLIRHQLCVPVRSTCTKHVSPRICRWWDTVDWPTSIASTTSPVVIGRASVASRLRIRIRVGSPSALNHPAHVDASSRDTVGAGIVEELSIDD